MSTVTSVVWFRRDLRVGDQPTFLAASDGPALALFVLDPALLTPSGAARRIFLYRNLRCLDEALGGRLMVVRGQLAGGDDDGIREWNDSAREDRRRLLESDLAGGEVHELRVLVPNRPGIVAEIALELGRATIDIVDMGLYPSSGSHGTVALWIRGGVVAEQAERLVRDLGLEVARA